jgi:hypothetical protein
MCKETLRSTVIELAEKILAKESWPFFPKKEVRGELTIIRDRTPGKKFRRAIVKIKDDQHMVTLIESNPWKVINAKNKVMVYWEKISDGRGGAGGAPPAKRVGQVRRYKNRLELVWFPPSRKNA